MVDKNWTQMEKGIPGIAAEQIWSWETGKVSRVSN